MRPPHASQIPYVPSFILRKASSMQTSSCQWFMATRQRISRSDALAAMSSTSAVSHRRLLWSRTDGVSSFSRRIRYLSVSAVCSRSSVFCRSRADCLRVPMATVLLTALLVHVGAFARTLLCTGLQPEAKPIVEGQRWQARLRQFHFAVEMSLGPTDLARREDWSLRTAFRARLPEVLRRAKATIPALHALLRGDSLFVQKTIRPDDVPLTHKLPEPDGPAAIRAFACRHFRSLRMWPA